LNRLSALVALDPYVPIASHESGHALGNFHYGRPIVEIDIARPSHGVSGHVVPAAFASTIPEGLSVDAALAYLDGLDFPERLATATIARLGACYGGDDWLGEECRHDRELVSDACPGAWEPDAWGMLVEITAEGIADDPRYRIPHGLLARALVADPHTAMSGERAFAIFSEALEPSGLTCSRRGAYQRR
jgi:hypothetical protein